MAAEALRAAGEPLLIATLLLAAAFSVPPTPTHYVTDTAGVLSESTRASLENELRSYEKITGHQAIVWIGKTTGDTVLEDWTSEVAHEWKIGRTGKDDGVILFLFTDDHKVRIEVGYGLEGELTDATASQIIRDDIVPAMRRGDVDGAVRTGAERIILAITPDFRSKLANPPPAEPTSTSRGAGAIAVIIWMLVALLIIFLPMTLIMVAIVAAFRGSKSGKGGTGSGWISSTGWTSGTSSTSSSDFSSGGGDFSAGGGDFGGGGASGSW